MSKFHLFLDEHNYPAKLLVTDTDASDWEQNTLFLNALDDFMGGDVKTLVIPGGGNDEVKVYDRA
jgi:hypothetical protein